MKLIPSLTLFLASACILGSSQAATINVDFGNPAGNAFDSQNFPYTGDGVIPGGPNVWNQVFTGGGTALPDSTGTATSVVVSLGQGTTRAGDINFDTGGGIQTFGRPATAAAGSLFITNAGLYRDWAFSGVDPDRVIGLRIAGLAAGAYNFYLYAQELKGDLTVRGGTLSLKFGATNAATGTVSFDDVAGTSSIVNTTTNDIGFSLGGNYQKITATVTAGQSFYIFGDFDVTGESASFNGLQIESVAVPEPTTTAVFGLAALGLLARRRRA